MNILSRTKRGIADLIPVESRRFLLYLFSLSNPYKDLSKDRKKIVIALAADYGNLGDVAITIAQKQFLQTYFPEYLIIELPISRTYRDLKALKSMLTPDDIVTLIGGGNTGSLYESTESQRRFVVSKLRKNRIVAFPQSTFYSTDKPNFLAKSESIFSAHKQLTFTARDKASFDFMSMNFRENNILYCPDIVLTLKKADNSVKRKKNKITLSVRSDKESALSSGQYKNLLTYLKKENYEIVFRDTELGRVHINAEARDQKLADIWDEYRSSSLVITDRLHGMIFSAITKTPCVAINNNNGKVLAAYNEWLNNLNHIIVLDEFDPILFQNAVISLIEKSSSGIDYPDLDDSFKLLFKEIEGPHHE